FTIIAGPTSLISSAVAAEGEASRGIGTPPGTGTIRYRDEVFAATTWQTDIVYGRATGFSGDTEDLVMDVVEPTGDTVTQRPLVIWAHGGGFFGGSRRTNDNLLEPWAKRGFVVASIDYRLIPAPGCEGGPLPTCLTGIANGVDDMQTAIRYFRANASTYGIDPTRVAVAGFSAGAVMSLGVAFSSEEEPDAAVGAAIVVAGRTVNQAVTPGDAPTLLFHGTEDATIPFASAASTLVQAWNAGLRSILVTIDGGTHAIGTTHRELILRDSVNFLWSQLNLTGAAR
ncbi:MAG TPA: alpha/beta hydrolase fold domain-containing protein, partial [Acidimicrobiales bacterium]|nr:alpha/beta hydrolase fold domain-containing protein [Acidimicrobiales bacterium]